MIKKIFIGLLSLLLLLILGVAIFIWQFDLDDYRQDIEAQLAQQTGITFEINGGLLLDTETALAVEARKVVISTPDGEIAQFETLRVATDWQTLLDKELRITEILLDKPVINLTLDKDGQPILPEPPPSPAPETPEPESTAGLPLNKAIIDKVRINQADIRVQQFTEEAPKELLDAKQLSIALNNIQLVDNQEIIIADWPNYLSKVALTSTISAQQIRYENYQLDDLKVDTHNKQQHVLSDIQFGLAGGLTKATTNFNWQESAQDIDLKMSARDLQLGKLLEMLELEQSGSGSFNLDVNSTSRADEATTWLKALKGNVALNGKGMALKGFSLNKLMTNLRESQELSLTDVGGIALAGPLALLVTKGSSYTGMLQGATGGETALQQLLVELDIKDEKIGFSDVALATDKNRLAVTGAFGTAKNTFDPINLYLLNDKGCQVFHQKLEGSVDKPEVGALAFAANSILNPVTSILKKGQEALTKCKAVYEGQVGHPASE